MQPKYNLSDADALISYLIRSEAPDGCWEWPGPRDSHGYGRATFAGKTELAHRIAWRLVAGPIPAPFRICHVCDNPACCRNDDEGWYEINGVFRPRRGHLWLGTQAENMQDAVRKGRMIQQTHPEHMQRGDQHWARRMPDRIPRGAAAGRRKHPERYPLGEARRDARLTADAVRAIRAARGTRSQYALAAQFGVSRSAIQGVLEGRTWKHVTLD